MYNFAVRKEIKSKEELVKKNREIIQEESIVLLFQWEITTLSRKIRLQL